MSESVPDDDVLAGIDFPDEHYQIEQSLIRNKYKVTNANGELVCRAKQKLFKVKEEFPFVNADGETVFRIKAANILDIAGDYELIDERTGETVAVIQKQLSVLKHIWRIRDPDSGELWAEITSGSRWLELLRNVAFLASLVPHKYTIDDDSGTQIGKIDGQFSMRDRYDLYLGDTGDAPREAVVAAAIAIDALEGN